MRTDTIAACQDGRELLDQAAEEIKRNPDMARALISDAKTVFADIQRWMVEAKQQG